MKIEKWQKTQIATHKIENSFASALNKYYIILSAPMWAFLVLIALYNYSVVSFLGGNIPFSALLLKYLISCIIALPFFAILNFLYIRKLQKEEEKITEQRVLRGESLIPPDDFKTQIEKESSLVIGEEQIPIPKKTETQHFLIIGKTGVGKTQTFLQVINQVIHNKCIIYDYKGDFITRFYDPATDYIFNPADPRCVQWCPLNEVENTHEYKLLACSIIPNNPLASDPFWFSAAQNVLTGIIKASKQQELTNNKAFFEAVNNTTPEDYQSVLDAQYAQYVNPEATHTTPGVLSEMRRYTSSLEFLENLGSSFRIRDWIADNSPSALFIVSNPLYEDSFRPLMNAFVTMLIQHIISRPDNPDSRTYLFLDEIGTLGHVPSLVRGLTLGRSKGLSAWVGIQDTAQLEHAYGKLAYTILTNAGSTVAMSVADPGTAEYLSRRFGQKEVEEYLENVTVTDAKESMGFSLQQRTKEIITVTEFMSLKSLQAYLKLSSVPDCTKITIPIFSEEKEKGGEK